jgi:hypothetical protein
MKAFINGERVANAIRRAGKFFSFLIGLGISVIIYHRDYLSIKTPALPLSEIMERVAKVDGKCYKYRVEDASCETSSST